MDFSDENLEDSALVLSAVQKRKASASLNSKNFKQQKLNPCQGYSTRNGTFGCSEEERNCKNSSKSKTINFSGSISSYFKLNQSISTCFLCLKKFEKDSGYVTHLKLCAKKHQMNTKQLLNMLELQKKNLKEKRTLELSSDNISISKKQSKTSELDYDLALGLALSESLETESKSFKENPVSTLEDFGFSSNITVSSKKKNFRNKKFLLKEQTEIERQKIITEKAAAVLLVEDKDIYEKLENLKQDFSKKTSTEVPHLWNLCQSEEKNNWYLDNLKDKLFLSDEDKIIKDKKHEEVTIEEESMEKVAAKSVDGEAEVKKLKDCENFKVEENKDLQKRTFTSMLSLNKNTLSETIKLELPNYNIYEDWKKMLNNEKFSDITGRTKDSQIFYLHSLVLFARCPHILDTDLQSIFLKFNLSTLLLFFEYLYCGSLNCLPKEEIRELINLAAVFNYEELINILNDVETNLSGKSESYIPSSLTPEGKEELTLIETAIVAEDADIFLEGFTQNNQGSSQQFANLKNKLSSPKQQCLSIFQYHQVEELETVETENQEILDAELSEKTNANMLQSLNECRKGESVLLKKADTLFELKLNDLATRESNKRVCEGNSPVNEIVVISSDTDTRDSKTSQHEIHSMDNFGHEIPYYDPYENCNAFSPVQTDENFHSQSFITGDVSFTMQNFQEKEDKSYTPDFSSTPLASRQTSKVFSNKKSGHKKRKSNFSTSRVLRKSLGLKNKSINKSMLNTKKKDKKLAEKITACVVEQLSNSVLLKSSLTWKGRKFLEMTPLSSREIELEESVTPSPNYSKMEESLIKDQLSKYGLKKTLAKGKAKKILRYIYDELHPLFNTETGKLVKILPNKTTKGKSRRNSKVKKTKEEKKLRYETPMKKTKNGSSFNPRFSKNDDTSSERSAITLESLVGYNSDSELDELNEPLTQSLPSNPVDLPSAFKDFLERNPKFHEKILLYEPIWLEDLQRDLKETFSKRFKLSDIKDYLDQGCITFRTTSQKRQNQRKNQKKN